MRDRKLLLLFKSSTIEEVHKIIIRCRKILSGMSESVLSGTKKSACAENIDSSIWSVPEAYAHESEGVGSRKLKIKGSGVVNVEIYRQQYDHTVYKIMFFFSIFLAAYAYGLDNLVRFTFQYQAASKYKNRDLLKAVNCVKMVIGAGGQLAYARASDIFGRITLLIFAILFYVVGTIIQSQAKDISRFSAGACIYQVGVTGIQLLLEIIAMDFSDLNWRLLASFVPALPFVINIWISGFITEAVGERWAWGIGMWAFILPLACIPLGLCLLHMRYLAMKNARDRLQNEFKLYEDLTWREFLIDIFFWRLDLMGVILVCTVFGCILIPLALAGGINSQWGAVHIIVPEVVGWVVALPVFLLWEAKIAKHPLVSWDLIQDRGILAALAIAFFINFIWYLQGDYMFTVLLVAFDESVLSASRITSLYSFVCVITGVLLGFVIVKARRTKPFIVFGICCWFLAFGLLIYFCGNSGSTSGVIGSLCLLGFGSGFFTYTTQASVQAATKTHARMAVITALYLSIYSIGSAVGSSVSGAIWTKVLPKEVYKTMDASLAAKAYGSPTIFILDNAWGTPSRVGLVEAYRYVQKILCTVGLCFCIPLLIAALFLRNPRLTNTVSLETNDQTPNDGEGEKNDFFQKIKWHFTKSGSMLPR